MSFVRELGSQQGNYDCDFPRSHLYKFSWEKIKENAPDVFHVLSNMYFDKDTLNSLLHKLQVGGGNSTSEKVACDWLRQNRDVWQAWLPSGTLNNIPVYIGGMFPLSVNEDAVWSRPGILEGANLLNSYHSFLLSPSPLISGSDITKNILCPKGNRIINFNVILFIKQLSFISPFPLL